MSGEVADFGNNLKSWECAKRARQFLDSRLPVIGLALDEPVKEQFLARVGSDTRQIASELEKLRCYAGPGKPVTAADVKSIVSGGGVTEIWDFLDAFGRRDLAGLIRQLRLLLSQSEHPIRLANSLESRVNDLILIREALDRQWAQADSYAGLRWNPLPPATEAWLAARDWVLPEPGAEADPLAGADLGPAARTLARDYAARAAEDARLLPLGPFLAALTQLGPEPALLAARFGAPMGAVFRRLATLPPGAAADFSPATGAGESTM